MENIRNINHFIGVEEENLLSSIENYGEDFFLIHNLDELYRSCSNIKTVNKGNPLGIPLFLFLNTHREFYIGMVSFLRMHMSKSFICLRTSLDFTFTACYLLKYPQKMDVYLSGAKDKKHPDWNKNFLNIKRTIKKNIKNFRLLKGLPEAHEYCSIYAHSDALGILQRYRLEEESIMSTYFDYHSNIDDDKKWLAHLLYFFFRIYLTFWHEVFKKNAGNKIKGIEYKISVYQEKLRLFIDKYPLKDSSQP